MQLEDEDYVDIEIPELGMLDILYLFISNCGERLLAARERFRNKFERSKRDIHRFMMPKRYYEARMAEINRRLPMIVLDHGFLEGSARLRQVYERSSFVYTRPGPLYGTYRARPNGHGRKKLLEAEHQKLHDERSALIKEGLTIERELRLLRPPALTKGPYR